MSGNLEKVEFYAEIKWETENAYIVFDGINELTLPKSMVEMRRLGGGDCEFQIPCWLAKKKGII